MLISFFGGFEERAGHVQRPAPPMPMPTPGARAPVAKHTDTTGFSFFFGGGGWFAAIVIDVTFAGNATTG